MLFRVLPLASACLIVSGAMVAAAAPAVNAASSANMTFARETFEGASLGSIESEVFDLALNAASCAVRSGKVSNPKTLTVIDYSRPSSQQRLWVIDLTTKDQASRRWCGLKGIWQGRKDSNPRMLESKSSAFTNLATPLHRTQQSCCTL